MSSYPVLQFGESDKLQANAINKKPRNFGPVTHPFEHH